jgi:hypothetical protein
MPETWWEYVTRISDGAAQKDIGPAAGVVPSQVSRWVKGSNPDAKHVIRFARHYQRPQVEALIAAGYLNEDEAAGIAQLTMSVRDMSSEGLASEIGSLVAELRRRVPAADQGEDWGEGSADWVGNTPEFQQHPAMRRRQS